MRKPVFTDWLVTRNGRHSRGETTDWNWRYLARREQASQQTPPKTRLFPRFQWDGEESRSEAHCSLNQCAFRRHGGVFTSDPLYASVTLRTARRAQPGFARRSPARSLAARDVRTSMAVKVTSASLSLPY